MPEDEINRHLLEHIGALEKEIHGPESTLARIATNVASIATDVAVLKDRPTHTPLDCPNNARIQVLEGNQQQMRGSLATVRVIAIVAGALGAFATVWRGLFR